MKAFFLDDSDSNDIKIRSRQLKQNFRLLWTGYLDNLKTTFTTKNILSSIFILGVSSICFQQCYSQLSEYFKYAIKTQISHSFPDSTLSLIPGVTICNNNRIRMIKLLEREPLLREKFAKYFNESGKDIPSVWAEFRLDRMRDVRELVESAVNTSALISESPISTLLDISSTSIIKDVDCNGLWGKQFNCENFRVIESFQSNPCYTLFYLGSILEALSTGAAFDFNTTRLGGRKKVNAFHDHEIAEILVDFDPYEHADFRRDIGGQIVIHSTGNIGSIRDMSFAIEPGWSYEIILSRRITKRLPPPYKSMCVDYRSMNTPEFTTKENSTPSVILDTTTCARNCIVKRTTKICNCWPVEVPYFPGDNLIDGAQNYRMCHWAFEEFPQNYSEALYTNCYKKFHTECRALCRRGCWAEDYKLHVISNPWPTKGMFMRATYDFEKGELQRLKTCCAKISLKYLEFTETKQIMIPSLTLAQLVSNIGGIVSGLIGVSAVTLYRYLTRNVLRCKVVNDNSPTSSARRATRVRSLKRKANVPV